MPFRCQITSKEWIKIIGCYNVGGFTRCSSGERRLKWASTNCWQLSSQMFSVHLCQLEHRFRCPKSLMDLPTVSSRSEMSWRHLFQALAIGVLASSLKSASLAYDEREHSDGMLHFDSVKTCRKVRYSQISYWTCRRIDWFLSGSKTISRMWLKPELGHLPVWYKMKQLTRSGMNAVCCNIHLCIDQELFNNILSFVVGSKLILFRGYPHTIICKIYLHILIQYAHYLSCNHWWTLPSYQHYF